MKAGITILIHYDSSLIGVDKTEEIRIRANKVMDNIKAISNLNFNSLVYTIGSNVIILEAILSRQEIEFILGKIKKIQEDMKFEDTISSLEENKLIDKVLADNINNVRKNRNKFIHQSLRKDIVTIKDLNETENLSKIAIESTSKIIEVYENIP